MVIRRAFHLYDPGSIPGLRMWAEICRSQSNSEGFSPGTPIFLPMKFDFHAKIRAVEWLNISLWLGRMGNHFLRNWRWIKYLFIYLFICLFIYLYIYLFIFFIYCKFLRIFIVNWLLINRKVPVNRLSYNNSFITRGSVAVCTLHEFELNLSSSGVVLTQ